MIADHVLGAAGAPALMLHCMLGRARDWQGLLGAMVTPLAARGFDLPGHGRSSPWDGASELHALCTSLARDRCAPGHVVIGHSFGATVALRLALEGASALRALVLIEPVLFAAAHGTSEASEEALHAAALAECFARGDLRATARGFLARWGAGPPFDSLPREAQARIAGRMPMVMATTALLRDDHAGLLRPGGLEGQDLPVMLLRGARSPRITAIINHRLAHRLARAERDEIAGAGHMVPITHPHETAERIDRFLAQLPGA